MVLHFFAQALAEVKKTEKTKMRTMNIDPKICHSNRSDHIFHFESLDLFEKGGAKEIGLRNLFKICLPRPPTQYSNL